MRLLIDEMCGDLRSYLRICGHDAAYAVDREVADDDEVLAIADREERTVVTRDRELARRADRSILVESTAVDEQLRRLRTAGVDLTLADRPARCGRCNGSLVETGRGADRPAYVPDDQSRTWRCESCGQWFWKGSHWDDVAETLDRL